MANTVFRFKQFTIHQDKTAMKIGTDGVLFGAWAHFLKSDWILDIGSGTGILSLIAAQNSQAQICAIDIEQDAYLQTKENAENSIFCNRIFAIHTSIQDFMIQNTILFGTIICNPPFFQNSLKSPNIQRNVARHTVSLEFEVLLDAVSKLLSEQGVFYVLLPIESKFKFDSFARQKKLCLQKCLYIKSVPYKNAHRVALCYGKNTNESISEETIVVEIESRKAYSMEYIQLTKEFYLEF